MSSPQPPPPPDPQAAQAGLAILVGLAIAQLWPSLDLLHLRESLPAFKAAVAREVQQHAQASATMAARQYRLERVAAGVGAGFTPRPASPPPLEQIAQAVDWAVQPLWDSSVPVAQFADAPEETRQVAGSAIADAKARLAASTEKLVLDVGRDTITSNVQRDRRAKAWARIAEPGACSFCAMLAGRGAVYHVQRGEFEAHDNCRCHVEPVFTAYEPSAQIREWQRLYDSTAQQIGYGTDAHVTAADMRVAFRQSFEGRSINLERSRNMRAERSGQPRTPNSSQGPTLHKSRAQSTPEEQAAMMRAELAALEKNVPRLTNDKQREWTQKRIDALRTQLNQQ